MALNERGRAADRPLGARGAAATCREPQRSARGRGARAKLRAAARLEELAARCERVAEPDRPSRARSEDHRSARVDRRPGRPADPQGQARQADRVRLRRPDLRGDREHPPRRPRLHPAGGHAREPGREHGCCPHRRRAQRAGIRPREIAPTAAFSVGPTKDAFRRRSATTRSSSPAGTSPAPPHPQTPSALPDRDRGPHQPPQTRLRATPLRLKGHDGMRIWTGWAILAYDLDTLAIRTR